MRMVWILQQLFFLDILIWACLAGLTNFAWVSLQKEASSWLSLDLQACPGPDMCEKHCPREQISTWIPKCCVSSLFLGAGDVTIYKHLWAWWDFLLLYGPLLLMLGQQETRGESQLQGDRRKVRKSSGSLQRKESEKQINVWNWGERNLYNARWRKWS